MTQPMRVSYIVIVLLLVIAAYLHLATPLLTILFSYFALEKLQLRGSKTMALILFFLLVLAAGGGFVYFLNEALHAFPRIADTALPALNNYAREHEIELPFRDLESLKALVLDALLGQMRYVGGRATLAAKQIAMLIIGVVVAVSLFLNTRIQLTRDLTGTHNYYTVLSEEIIARVRGFYRSFVTVMGAQMAISGINTVLTAIFVIWVRLPYASLLIVVTFLCGLLPIIGNLISNTIIVSVAFTITPKLGIAALAFLVVLHKLEYFLNSKIIGGRIRNPMWLTLLALVIAERLMGVAGMILAPVILHFIRIETSKFPAPSRGPSPAQAREEIAAQPEREPRA